MTKAYDTAQAIAANATPERYAMIAVGLGVHNHPQSRTYQFHRFYGAPIGNLNKATRRFEHMEDERVAFRLAFMLEELREIFRDGFGIEMECEFTAPAPHVEQQEFSASTLEMKAHDAILLCMCETRKRDIVEVVDGLGDLNVVVNGFATELGVDMNLVDREIAASNFTKADENGNPIISDGTNGNPIGKVLKGPNFVKPDIATVIGLKEGE